MKYYIFGSLSRSSELFAKQKDAYFVSDSLDESLDEFRYAIDEIKFTHLYLLVDFDNGGNNKMSGYASIDMDASIMPFFLIGEWHLGDNKIDIIRCDHTAIKKRGFVHEFENNVIALREFLYCVDKAIDAEFSILYTRDYEYSGHRYSKSFERKIANSTDIIRKLKVLGYDNTNLIKKFHIDTPSWDFVELRNKQLANIIIPTTKDLMLARL